MTGTFQAQPSHSPVGHDDQPFAEFTRLRFEDIAEFEKILHVAKFELTQIGRGALQGEAACLRIGDMRLVHETHHPALVWITTFEPSLVVFVLPIRWRGELAYNGQIAERFHLFRFSDPAGYFGRNAQGGREVISVGLSRQELVAAIAALRRVGIDQIEIGNGALRLDEEKADALRVLLSHTIGDAAANPDMLNDAAYMAGLADRIKAALVDTFVGALSSDDHENRQALSPATIVRRAETLFAQTPDRKVSLADLCAATQVSVPTLYKAFDAVCGITPLRYFRLRRMSLARAVLRKAPHDRGQVKSAALGVGLTELGRFAAEYRNLFGERPSTTLQGSDDAQLATAEVDTDELEKTSAAPATSS